MAGLLIRRAEVGARGECDVRVAGGRIAELERTLEPFPGEEILEASGGALIPGLHDHHIHLFGLAALEASVQCGPPSVPDRATLERVFAQALPRKGWLRGVGYHEIVAGELDRKGLDAITPAGVAVRLQHRTGAMWMLNSAAVEHLGLDAGPLPAGVERAKDGRVTGRIYDEDVWLRERLASEAPPDLSPLGCRLAAFGVTGVTDATPGKGSADLALLEAAVDRGELAQQIVVMANADAHLSRDSSLERGAVKIMLREPAFPAFESLRDEIAAAHSAGLPCAIHCVTRSELVFALSALDAAGPHPADRIEHASVTPPELLDLLAERSICVVTQPGFIFERGDVYAKTVEAVDRPWLYRGRGFVDAGVALGGGTDAPYGDPDPWLAMRAAVDRRSRDGLLLGEAEALSPEAALALFSSPPECPGGAPRRIEVGATADLCLLDAPWRIVREALSSKRVAATLRNGRILWRRDVAEANR